MEKDKQNGLVQSYFTTFFTQSFAVVCGILLTKLMTVLLSKEAMGLFVIIRRVVAFSFAVVSVNLGMAIAKFISSDSRKSAVYFDVGIIIFLVNFCLVSGMVFLFKRNVALILFGGEKYESLILPMLLYMLSMGVYNFSINYYRGGQRFKLMNILTILYWVAALGVLPLCYFKRDADVFLIRSYFIYFSVTVVGLLLVYNFFFAGHKILSLTLKDLKNDVGTLVKYGGMRLPSVFFFAGIFFLPVFFSARFFGLEEAAVMGLVIYVVQVLHVFASAMSLLLLPSFSYRNSVYGVNVVKRDFFNLFELILSFFMFLGVVLFFFSKEVIWIMFTESYWEYVSLFKLASLCVGFYLSYIACRSVLDGLYVTPYSTFVNLCGAIIFVAFAHLFKSFGLRGVVFSFVLSQVAISVCSIFVLKEKLRVKGLLINKKNLSIVFWIITVFAIFFVVQVWAEKHDIFISLLYKSFILVIVLAASFVVYKKLGLFWVRKVCDMVNK
ncbi:MAG: hypothetical protein J7K33_04430 [Candidatus Marinimicrobia bacterium]|nr:hypothetical protein [Candidatus Neomarinimicrobiota bacterium]